MKDSGEWPIKDRDGREIYLAPQIRIEQYEDIATYFFPKILNRNYEECLITDESSLYDFDKEEVSLKRIKKVYGLDVSDIKGLILVKIFERISVLGK